MKLFSTLLLFVLSFSLSAQMQLNSRVDSLNYAFGLANGDGIRLNIIAKDTSNAEQVSLFIQGFDMAFDTLKSESKSYADAAYFVYMMSTYVIDDNLFGDSTIAYNPKLFYKMFANTLSGKKVPMSVENAGLYVQSVMNTPVDSGAIRSKSQIDSLNAAFAIVNAEGVKKQILNADTTKKDIKAFLKNYTKINKSKDENSMFIQGIRVGRTFFQQVIGAKYLMGDESVMFNASIISEATKEAIINQDYSLMSLQQAGDYLNLFVVQKEAKKHEVIIMQGAQFLAENAKEKGMQVTESGLQYFVNKLGDGEKPTAENTVKVHYEGRLLSGQIFDSSIKRGEPITFPLSQVIPGWTEGVQLMPVGSKFTFFIPYNLAYGAQGAGDLVPPYAVLIFEVELLDIVK